MSEQKKPFPAWAEEVRRRFKRGESSIFVLHGNVYETFLRPPTDPSATTANGDQAPAAQLEAISLTDFLSEDLLGNNKQTCAIYNVATGVHFARVAGERDTEKLSALFSAGDVCQQMLGTPHPSFTEKKQDALAALEHFLVRWQPAGLPKDRTGKAVIIEYAEAVAPAGDPAFQSDWDRSAVVTLHRWSFLPEITNSDSVVIVITESLSALAPKILSNPRVATIEIPMPDQAERLEVIRSADPHLPESDATRFAEITAGLKCIQIASLVTPAPGDEHGQARRETLIEDLLTGTPEARTGARELATLTAGKTDSEIQSLLKPNATAGSTLPKAPTTSARTETEKLITAKKREILERECYGLLEFLTPDYGFDAVGGMDPVIEDLMAIAEQIKAGDRRRAPMGVLFVGPPGTGKTFLAKAFAKESGITIVVFRNFRSKWVGSTESNFEKILTVLKALGEVIVVIDEAERVIGNAEDSDTDPTASRVKAKLKEFMSDTSHRGRIMFFLMTNRPDLIDVDLKRAGRIDLKIPFFYPDSEEQIEQVAAATIRKEKYAQNMDLASMREKFSKRLVGYSNADVSEVLRLAYNGAAKKRGTEATLTEEDLVEAVQDYFPSRDTEMLEYMELLAVFEASSRKLLPTKYRELEPEELDRRLREKRMIIGRRR
jgi:SpoVK/Ycf46/Vps4 family AAA+-type ATPase